MRALLVYNPLARLASRVPCDVIEAELRRLDSSLEVVTCADNACARDAVHEALSDGVERVIVAGGDGTVNAAVQMLADRPVTLGVIPLGTGNVLAAEVGLRPGDWQRGCRWAVGGEVVGVDLGCANGRYFVTMLGVGLDARIVDDLADQGKANYGRPAFGAQFVSTLASYEPACFSIDVDGERLEVVGWAAIVSNTARYAWRLHFCRGASPFDGVLDLRVMAAATKTGLAASLSFGFLTGCVPPGNGASSRRFRRAHIDADRELPWQTDGDLAGVTPVEVEARPAALRVAVGPGSRLHRSTPGAGDR